MRSFVAGVSIAFVGVASLAAPQDARGYAGGAGLFSDQTSSRPGESPSLPRTGVGGSSFGGALEVGGYLVPNVSVSAELSVPARITSVQETDYFQSFRTENRYRDLIVSALVHVHSPRVGVMRFEAAGGPSLVQESTIQRRADAMGTFGTFSGLFGPYGAESEATRLAFGAAFGGGVEMALGRHLSLVPEVRIHWVRRSSDPSDRTWSLGLSPWVYRPAVAIRARF